MPFSIGRCTSENVTENRSRSKLLAAALAALTIAMAPAVALAGGSTAAELRSRGDTAMDDGAYATAIEMYRASHELTHDPALLYNVGNAYEHLGDYPNALAYLERFAATAAPGLKTRVPHLEEFLATLRTKLGILVVRCSVPGARVIVHGAVTEKTPLETDIAAMPGATRVEVIAEGYRPFVREIVLTAGKEARLDAALVPALALQGAPSTMPSDGARAAPATTASARGKQQGTGSVADKWWLWTGAAVVVGSVVAVAVLAATGTTSRATSSGAVPDPAGRVATARFGLGTVTW
jgi:hypothetical protein